MDSLKLALDFMGIKKLPEEKLTTGEYSTRAIVKVEKRSGIAYVIGEWDITIGDTVVKKDFTPNDGFVEKILAVYPVLEGKTKAALKKEKEAFDKQIDKMTVEELKDLLDNECIPFKPNDSKAKLLALYREFK